MYVGIAVVCVLVARFRVFSGGGRLCPWSRNGGCSLFCCSCFRGSWGFGGWWLGCFLVGVVFAACCRIVLVVWCPPLLWWLWVAPPFGRGGLALRLSGGRSLSTGELIEKKGGMNWESRTGETMPGRSSGTCRNSLWSQEFACETRILVRGCRVREQGRVRGFFFHLSRAFWFRTASGVFWVKLSQDSARSCHFTWLGGIAMMVPGSGCAYALRSCGNWKNRRACFMSCAPAGVFCT